MKVTMHVYVLEMGERRDAREAPLHVFLSHLCEQVCSEYARRCPISQRDRSIAWQRSHRGEHGGGGPPKPGTAEQVADEMERWVNEADVDGFNIAYALYPRTFEEVGAKLLPVLRERGLFWEDYAVPGGTYRENIAGRKGAARPAEDHPAAKWHWKAE